MVLSTRRHASDDSAGQHGIEISHDRQAPSECASVARADGLMDHCRGLVRQLGRPALLAAVYSGDGPGTAAAAMAEVGAVLVSSLHELERGTTSSAGAVCRWPVPSYELDSDLSAKSASDDT